MIKLEELDEGYECPEVPFLVAQQENEQLMKLIGRPSVVGTEV
jgi:hypothetical protein